MGGYSSPAAAHVPRSVRSGRWQLYHTRRSVVILFYTFVACFNIFMYIYYIPTYTTRDLVCG